MGSDYRDGRGRNGLIFMLFWRGLYRKQ